MGKCSLNHAQERGNSLKRSLFQEIDFIMLIFITFEPFEIDRCATSHLKDIFKSFPNHSYFFRINVDLTEICPTELDALFFKR